MNKTFLIDVNEDIAIRYQIANFSLNLNTSKWNTILFYLGWVDDSYELDTHAFMHGLGSGSGSDLPRRVCRSVCKCICACESASISQVMKITTREYVDL